MIWPKQRLHRWIAVLVLAAVLVSAVAVARSGRGRGDGLTGSVVVSASSTALGFTPRQTVTAENPGDPDRGWRSASETTGAWIELDWPQPVTLRRVVLERNPLNRPGIAAGFLSFADGSNVQVKLTSNSRLTVVPVTARSVSWLRFTVSAVDAGAAFVSLTHLGVDDQPRPDDVVTDARADGDVAAAATLSSSANGGAAALRALVDSDPSHLSTGEVWRVDQPTGVWIQLNWPRPRELTTISLAGAAGSAQLRSATVQFSDGSSLALGAVLADSSRPTVVSFMPRVTDWIRLTLGATDGAASTTLAELSTYQRGAPPRRPVGGSGSTPARTSPGCGETLLRPSNAIGLVIRCPTAGAVVGDSIVVQVATGPAYTSVNATIWPGDVSAAVPPTLEGIPSGDGITSFDIDLSGLPAGPFTIRFEASSGFGTLVSASYQLDKRGQGASSTPTATPAVEGRSLVYDEEFDRPLSISRTGEGADYAAAKPVVGTAEDFGDAIFADPSAGLGNVSVVDQRYLRISVQPRPSDFPDPQGWGREHIGGLLASARPGGSGFSAQYGYFEARMLAPSAPGTWPAFWMLPTPNLVSPQPAVAEIDAVELYGHEPTGACHTTHEYADGNSGGVARCGSRWSSEREAAAWHTYGVAVSPTLVSFYIDGKLTVTSPQVRGGEQPLFFLVDLALGGGWPVNLASVQERADLYVDYVRVYV